MRTFTSAAAAGIALLASLLGAVPVSAAALTPVTVSCSGGTLVLSANNLTAAANDTIDITNSTGLAITSYSTSYAQAVSVPSPWANGTVGSFKVNRSGSASVQMTTAAGSPCGNESITLSFNSGGGGGGSSSSAASAPVLETLTLEVSTGNTSCSGGSPTGYTGSWLQLPAADACSRSGPNANPKAMLLGWATDPIFPVSVAQQIVDLKYGPIDGDFYGKRMIFIPAGGWTYVSSSNTLYPIWSS